MARIIKATEIDASQSPRVTALRLKELAAEVRDVVVDARRQAARIIAAAREQAHTAQVQAEARGLAEGRRQAREEARRNIDAEAAQLAKLIGQMSTELTEVRAGAAAALRNEVVELAVMLAERIVGSLGSVDVAAAKHNLAKALELADVRGRICIHVAASQLVQLQAHCVQLTDLLSGAKDIQIVVDDSVSPGGVKLVSSHGEIDATLETQLANIAEALLGRRYESFLGRYQSDAVGSEVAHESA